MMFEPELSHLNARFSVSRDPAVYGLDSSPRWATSNDKFQFLEDRN